MIAEQFPDPRPAMAPVSLDALSDIPVRLSVEVGSTAIRIADLLGAEPGQVIELDRQADDFLDIMANGTLVARGEVVQVDNHYAVRVTEVIGTAPRNGPVERRR